jgi:excisionase family DNA binding protein
LPWAEHEKEAERLDAKAIEPALKVWFRPEKAAAYLGIGRTRIYALLTAEEIPSVKVGRTRHVRRADLDGYREHKLDGVAK